MPKDLRSYLDELRARDAEADENRLIVDVDTEVDRIYELPGVARALQERGRYNHSTLNRSHAGDGDTLLALELNGEPLALDHGFPVRLIGPNRPGVLQTKWVGRLVVRA